MSHDHETDKITVLSPGNMQQMSLYRCWQKREWYLKQGRIHGRTVVENWAGAVMQKTLAIQKCDGRMGWRTNRPTDRLTDRPTRQGVELRVRDWKIDKAFLRNVISEHWLRRRKLLATSEKGAGFKSTVLFQNHSILASQMFGSSLPMYVFWFI